MRSARGQFLGRVRSLDEESAGFVYAHWDGTTETEDKIKFDENTIRCCTLSDEQEEGNCILTDKPNKQRVVFAKAYWLNLR